MTALRNRDCTPLFNKRGSALVSGLIGAAIIVTVGTAVFSAYRSNSQLRSSELNRVVANSYATELAEYFRSKTSAQILNKYAWKLCETITTQDPVNALVTRVDGELVPVTFRNGASANRSYSIKVIDILTKKQNMAACGQPIPTYYLQSNERYVIDVKIEWMAKVSESSESAKNVEVVSVLLPDGVGANCVTGTETRVFSGNPFEIRDFVNLKSLSAVVDDSGPDASAINFDDDSAIKVCELTGYPIVVDKGDYSFPKYENGTGFWPVAAHQMSRWNSLTDAWDSQPAAAVGNRWLASLTCGCPAATPITDDYCDPNTPGGMINFERLPSGTFPDSAAGWDANEHMLPLSNQYLATHGVTFCYDSNSNNICDVADPPVYIRKEATARSSYQSSSFYCVDPRLCGGDPAEGWYDSLFFPYLSQGGKFFATTSTNFFAARPLLIQYAQPVAQVSGQLLDIGWDGFHGGYDDISVSAIMASGTDTLTIQPGKTDMTARGIITPWYFDHAGNKDITAIRITTARENVALDNFAPQKVCEYRPPAACDGKTVGGLITFERMPDGTPMDDPSTGWTGTLKPISSEFFASHGVDICREGLNKLSCAGPAVVRFDAAPTDVNAGKFYLSDDDGTDGMNQAIILTLASPTDKISGEIKRPSGALVFGTSVFRAEAYDDTGKRLENVYLNMYPNTLVLTWSFKSLTKNIKRVRLSTSIGTVAIDNIAVSEICFGSEQPTFCDPSLPAGGYSTTHPVSFNGTHGFDSTARAVALSYQHSSIYVGGDFSQYGYPAQGDGVNRFANILYFGQENSYTSQFNPAFDGAVKAIQTVNDFPALNQSWLYVAGSFTSYNDTASGNITLSKVAKLRLDQNGAPDPMFTAFSTLNGGTNGDVNALAITNIGLLTSNLRLYIGGSFTSVQSQPRARIARLNSTTGAIDLTFNPGVGFNATVNSIAPSNDISRAIYVGGDFTSYQGVNVGRIAKLRPDATLDLAFNGGGAGFDGPVNVITRNSDGSIYVGGLFTSYNGIPVSNIAKLSSTGTLDASFNAGTGFNNAVFAIVLTNDESNDLYVGGAFTSYNGSARNRLVRLTQNGVLNNTFDIGTGFNDDVLSIAMDCSNDLYVVGSFTTYNNCRHPRLARLDDTGSSRQSCAAVPSLPTVDVTANGQQGPITLAAGSQATIAWSSTNAVSCSVDPTGWSGISGSQLSGNLNSTTSFSVTCSNGAGDTVTDQVTITVIDPCDPTEVAGLINFEKLPSGSAPVPRQLIGDEYRASHGIRFRLGNGNMPMIGEIDGPAKEGYGCEHGDGSCSSPNDGYRGTNTMGRFFLTDDDAIATPIDLIIDYDFAVNEVSFGIIDIDGGEKWDISAYDASNNLLGPVVTIQAPAADNQANDGKETQVSISRPGIRRLVLHPYNWATFGLGLDNFSPSKICAPPPPPADPCDPAVAGGKINFEKYPNNSTPSQFDGVTNQWAASHGITFCFDSARNGTCNGGGAPIIARVGGSKAAYNCDSGTFDCVNGAGNAAKIGSYFLTAGDDVTKPILVRYATPVSAASGDFLDIEDTATFEEARVIPLDQFGNPIPGATRIVNEYSPGAGDGRPTRWSVNVGAPIIHAIRFQFTDDGLSLDNFAPGAVCP